LLFWGQIFTTKGSRLHVWQGRSYYAAGCLVALSAVFSTFLRLGTAVVDGVRPQDRPAEFASVVFLGYLGVVVFIVLQRAVLAIASRKGRPFLWRAVQLVLAAIALSSSVALVTYVAVFTPPNGLLLIALSPLGFLLSAEMATFALRRTVEDYAWLLEHMDAMLGSGIAFHTAFAVFGARSVIDPLFADTGWELAPWLAPAAIGIPSSAIWKRIQRRRFEAAERRG
ncbi:MAG: hypothetical protein AAGC56_07990, partial [Pseudomonadota bacterium]